jgi:hypothetical protein
MQSHKATGYNPLHLTLREGLFKPAPLPVGQKRALFKPANAKRREDAQRLVMVQ